jgi:hypothetical protein
MHYRSASAPGVDAKPVRGGNAWRKVPGKPLQGISPAVGFARKVIRCKELSDSIFSNRRSLALRQSRSESCCPLSPDGDMVSFCHEPGNLVGCSRRRTGC